MAVKKTIELDVKTADGLKAMKDLGLSFEEAFTEADNLSGQIGELEDALYAMAAAGQQNTKEYKELSQQVGVYKKVIIDTDMEVDALSQTTAQNLGGALGGVASGFELGAGAMGAFGTESAVVEEALLKVASAMAMAQGLQGIREAQKSFKGLKAQVLGTAAATKIYDFVQNGFSKSTKKASLGLKVFRGALISTGIGAIVVGIGMLIANFDTVSKAVKGAVAKFRDMGVVMKVLLYPITALIAAYDLLMGGLQAMGIIDSEETKKAKANAAERVTATEKQSEATGKRYDYEIAKAQAAGKDTFKLEEQKRAAFRETTERQIEAIKNLAILNKKFTDEQKEQVKGLYESINKSSMDSNLAQIANDKKGNEKRLSNHKQFLADKKAAEDIHQAVLRELKEHEISLIEDDFERERATILNNFAIKREDLLANFKGTEEDKLKLIDIYYDKEVIALDANHAKKLLDAKTKANEIAEASKPSDGLPDVGGMPSDVMLEIEAEEMRQQALFDIKKKWDDEGQAMTAAGLENAMQALTAIDDLSNAINEKKLQDIDNETKSITDKYDIEIAQLEASGKSTEIAEKKKAVALEAQRVAKEKQEKLGFERSKKIQMGMAIITGIQGVMAAFTAGSSIVPAGVIMGPLMAGLAAVTAGVNVAKIASTKYEGGGGGAPDVPKSPTLPSAGGVDGPSFNIVGNSSENQLATSLGGKEEPVIKTYVVSEDVTTAQSLDRNRVDTATL
jgi:hypothetical protein